MKRHDFCSLRIYLTMKQTRTGASVWQKLVGRSLGSYLVQEGTRPTDHVGHGRGGVSYRKPDGDTSGMG
jgi:hypothetical protein